MQYTYDPIFVGDININNVVAIKSLLRCFEIASGLKVNSLKSRFGGIKVEEEDAERKCGKCKSAEKRKRNEVLHLKSPPGGN